MRDLVDLVATLINQAGDDIAALFPSELDVEDRAGLRQRQPTVAIVEDYVELVGDLIVETREALAFYLDRRWGLDRPDARLERASDR